MEGLKDPSPFCFEKNEGRLFGLKVFIQNQEFSALNVYHYPSLKLKHLMEESSQFFSPQSKNILAGDLNWDLNKTNCQKLIEHLSEAWRLTALWKDKHKEAHLFKKLWKLQTLVKRLRTTQILRKDSPAHLFTSLEAELRKATAENWDNPPKGQKWRLKIIPQMIKVGLSQISSLEQQLRVFLNNHPAHSNKKSSSKVKEVIVDGILSHDSYTVRKAIKGF